MSSSASDPKTPHSDERAELDEFAVTLGAYLKALMAAGFKRGEAQQIVLQYQEIRMIPTPVMLDPEEAARARQDV